MLHKSTAMGVANAACGTPAHFGMSVGSGQDVATPRRPRDGMATSCVPVVRSQIARRVVGLGARYPCRR
jgi:hypothetical protein